MNDRATALEACDLGWSIAMIGRGYAAVVDPVFADVPRGARGYQLLHTVIHKSIRSQTALADYLGVDRTVMPYFVDDLQAAGLVERQDDPADRRRRIVAATRHGRARYAELSERVLEAERVFFGDLPDGERSAFVATLATMAHRSRELAAQRR
ncbi:MarR family winged helix-turn-helix transcriptional regulator [Tsukamurella sp. 1534]|uniref:MarR family winged helix-turn-helix transcriptional regulator n=1 Tax=Tsukamurella sp. 1534 TaxID=1151061 RepID=UPI0005946AA7|nr:MarR family winged helix-turn-helix transcriptional regulator [Tsukamurella sp. 1534]